MLTAALAYLLAEHRHGTYRAPGATIHLEQLPDDGEGIMVAFAPTPRSEVYGYRRHGIQVVVRAVRGGRSRGGWEAADAIRSQLDGLRHVTLVDPDGDDVRVVWLLSDDDGPTSLGVDANGRLRWSLRFTALVAHETPLTAALS